MPRILKHYSNEVDVKSYGYTFDFTEERKAKERAKLEAQREKETAKAIKNKMAEGNDEDTKKEKETEKEKKEQDTPSKLLDEIIEEAMKKADDIKIKALQEAEEIKKKAYEEGQEEGFKAGYKNGYEKSYSDSSKKLELETQMFLKQLAAVIKDAETKKEEILHKYKSDLKNLAIAAAEKVIHVSLKSSGAIIQKMIISATEKLKTRAWAKIYVAKTDVDLMVQGDTEFINSLSHLSDHVKIIAMENEVPGTCIVELPDEIIDASASTQMENIKEILNNTNL